MYFILAGGTPNADLLLLSSHYLHLRGVRGNAVAISPKMALTALHGHCELGDAVRLVDSKGVSRSGTITFVEFEELKVDVALIELDEGALFGNYIPPAKHAVKLLQQICVVGLLPSLANPDESSGYSFSSAVMVIERDSTLFRASYYSENGLSGAGIIVTLDSGQFRLVGVHVASHESTVAPPPMKRTKRGSGADCDSASESSSSLAASIHGHTAYSIVCEVVRVSGLKAKLVDLHL